MTGRPEDELEDAPEEDGRSTLRWVSGVLVAVAVLPPVVLAEVARRFLSGSADAHYFGAFVSAEEVRARLDFTASVRFRLFWASVPVPEVLLATLPLVLALCAVVVAGSPDWLVPPRWARRVVAASCVLTALESLACLVMLVDLTDAPRSEAYGNLQLTYLLPATGGFPEIAPVLALLVVTAVGPAIAALVLWRAARPVLVVEADAEPQEPEEPAEPEEPGEPEVPGLPRPSVEELDDYRRPG